MINCPLCNSNDLLEFDIISENIYLKCEKCHLIFKHPQHHLNKSEELKRYSFHQNNIKDEGYIKFLDQIINPALEYIDVQMTGLDFGCGPDPVLAQLLKNRNISCDFYDPYFFPETDNNRKYDFIFATECFEHFFKPAKEITTISKTLNNNGILAVMTEFYSQKQYFKDWYYIKDPTHVCFYNLDVFDFICTEFGFKKLFTDNKRVVILKNLKIKDRKV